MKTGTLVRYALAGLAVIILGALAGWYFFLKSQTIATVNLGTSRGFGVQSPLGSGAGSTGESVASSLGSGGAPGSVPQPPALWHVTKAAVGGIGFATSTQGSRLRYAERATGYIFEADPASGGLIRLTNTLAPKVYEAYFAPPNRVIERSVDASGEITTFAGFIGPSTSSVLTGISLPKNIAAVSADPKTDQLVFLRVEGSGIAAVISGWDGSKQKQVLSSALPGWRAWWLSDGRMVFVQNAADAVSGYAYIFKDGVLSPLMGPLPGLTVLPRTGSSALLYGTSFRGALGLFVQVSAASTPVRLMIATVADKCVWSPDSAKASSGTAGTALIAYCAVPQTPPLGDFLGPWYRGEIHPKDAIWRIDAGAGQAQLIFTPSSDLSLDVINPTMDGAGKYFAFMNATDESPWLLRLDK